MSINYFDEIFFQKYINSEDEALDICHKHVTGIIDTIILWLFFWVLIPSFFYHYNSFHIQEIVEFIYFEAYLFVIYIFLLYQIFDWYNDVWIITEKWIIDLDWQFFKTNIVYIGYEDIKWIELKQSTMWDWFLNKWNIIIHLEWENSDFILEDAKSPQQIVWYIQWVIEDKVKAEEKEDIDSFETLISALKKVVKENMKIEREEVEEIDETQKEIEIIKKRKGTIDLRW
ncbi:MAG: hypothetical protein ACD_4C00269G0001 [uncultured bacterium (gcode 4)]|uniref:DUF304 domain-containing protein n=1 Tax=uncultured bacterium (gcode 4) TaxID=1234023 RepID=K2F5X6_9BACT|nr:MAG: hypothetical protein ACD_4C00269G0001 [uncultured bacterium (gcode 4)]